MMQFFGLLLALLPAYLLRFQIFGVPTTGLEILLAVFLLIAAFKLQWTDLDKIKNLGRINYAIGLFILAGVISTVISPDKVHALGQLKSFIIEPMLLFYAAVSTLDYQKIKIPLRWLFASAVVISLFGLLQYKSFVHLPLRFWGTGGEPERITSFFDYPNALALYLAPLIGLFFALAINKFDLFQKKWIEWTGLTIMGLALLLTFSRGAWFALAVGLLWVLIKKFGIKKTSVTTLGLIVLLLLVPAFRHRLTLSDASSEAHGNLIVFGLHKVAEHPIIGTGLASFATFNQGVNYPHNIILNFWLEMGLLGLASFIWIVYLVLQKFKKAPAALTFAASVYLVIMLIHGLVDVPYFKNDLSVLFWFVISLLYI